MVTFEKILVLHQDRSYFEHPDTGTVCIKVGEDTYWEFLGSWCGDVPNWALHAPKTMEDITIEVKVVTKPRHRYIPRHA